MRPARRAASTRRPEASLLLGCTPGGGEAAAPPRARRGGRGGRGRRQPRLAATASGAPPAGRPAELEARRVEPSRRFRQTRRRDGDWQRRGWYVAVAGVAAIVV